jgi:hypothetical protein
MFDIHLTAAAITNDWPAVIGKLPKPITDLIDAFEATIYVQGPYTGVDAGSITAKNAEQHVRDITDALSKDAHFEEARSRVLSALARNILHSAGAAVPEIIESLRPKFDAATAEFTEAVSALPDDVSSDALVAAGAATLSQYHRAIAAQQGIARIDGWLASLLSLPAYAAHATEQTLRVLNPTTRGQLKGLLNAASGSGGQPLDPIYVFAVKEEIGFEMHTPTETTAIRQAIDSLPVENNAIQFLKIGA